MFTKIIFCIIILQTPSRTQTRSDKRLNAKEDQTMTANKRTKPTSAANKSASTPKTTRKRLAAIKLEPFETFEQEDAPTVRRKAGRPKGSGKYGEETKPMRIPVSMVERIEAFIERKGLQCRLYNEQIQAGFPSPAEDSPFEVLDLAEYLIPNPASTFLVRVTGDSMRDAGIFPGDVLIVDRSVEPSNGDVVVAAVDGDFTVKRLFQTLNSVELRPENKQFPLIRVEGETELVVWGVVKRVIHNL